VTPENPPVVASESMPEVVYRRLARDGAYRLGEIDCSETIDGAYRLRAGALVLEEGPKELKRWPPRILELETVVQLTLFDRGGVIYGAFFGDRVVGFMSLDSRPVCGMHDRLLLDTLHIDRNFRGRGLGCALLEHARSIAREMGATSLYVSAKPSKHTVEFYMRRGFVLADEYDPEQLAHYPEDIPMVLAL
jgi:GNAT superfamily N-acetyltransferase